MDEAVVETEVLNEEEEVKEKRPPITVGIKYNVFWGISILYLIIPVMLFFAFFLKAVWAVLFTLAAGVAVVWGIKDINKTDYSLLNEKSNEIRISPFLLVFSAILALLWAYISGVGEFAWATADHTVRAAVLNDLVNYKWPVVYDMATQMNPNVSSNLPQGTAMFAYYFTFWLVPAAVGKLFGIFAARVALLIWAALGIYLTMIGLFMMQKKASWAAPLFFFFFGGLDIIPFLFQTNIQNVPSTWEGWNYELWIHGNFYQTMNTFHQSIPGWLITILIIDSRNKRHIGTMGSLMFCYSPWATIGILPIAIHELLSSKWGECTLKNKIKTAITYGNLVMPIIIFAVFSLFYTANPNATSIKGFIWTFFGGNYKLLGLTYLGYVVFEFGIWSLVILKDNLRNSLYWVTIITLLIFPIYKISEANDLLMRGTLPPMFVVFALSLVKLDKVIERFKKRGKNNDFRALGLFAVVFATAMVPFCFLTTEIGATREIYLGIDQTVQPQDKIVSFGNIVDEEYVEVTKRQFYVFEYEDQLFYKVFGKS